MVELLPILRCIHTQSRLRIADAQECRQLNSAIAAGRVYDHLGRRVSRPLDRALINEQATYAFPVYDGIAHLLSDESIPLDTFNKQINSPDKSTKVPK